MDLGFDDSELLSFCSLRAFESLIAQIFGISYEFDHVIGLFMT
jgi:hypothetical protein